MFTLRSVTLAILALALNVQVLAAHQDVERHIEHIQNGLLPPVLVQGEQPAASSLQSRMTALRVPGVSIAVIHGGRIEWARGFGQSKVDGPAVTASTLFQAASITKPVTAFAAMRLVQECKLDLDSDVSRYLEAWKLPSSEFTSASKVTLRGLLAHFAGVTVHGFPGYAAGDPLPTLPQILNGDLPANTPPIRVDIEPGKIPRYSGGGYEIVQAVVQDVTGTSFAKLMNSLVLRPLNMRESTFEQPLPRALQSKVATPYQADGSPVAGGPHVYPELAAAGLWTTPSDLARYAIGMQRVLAGKAPRVMAASTAQEMLTPVIGQQAIGWVVGGAKENAYFRHGGANAGYRCLLVAYQHGDGVAIMSNSDSGDGLMLEILRTVAHEYGWPDHAPPVRIPGAVSPESFDPFAGAYRLDSGAEVTFWREGSRIRYRIFAQPAEELYATSEREYFLKTSEVRWTFSQPATPAEPAAVLYQSERKHPAQRLSGTESEIVLRNALETQKRFDEQRPDPDSENALRHWIDEVKSGAPDYDRMQPELAKIVRNKLPELQAALSQFGVVQTVRFKAVNAAGGDSFDIDFERGQRQFEILLRADRRIHDVRFTP